jgi:hypothetical protein
VKKFLSAEKQCLPGKQQWIIKVLDLERQAIWQQNILDGSWKLIIRDERIIWVDASDVSTDGYLYVTE